jgi:hypothetical protein
MQREIKFRVWSKRKNEMFYLAENTAGRYGLQINNQAWGMFDYDDGDGSCE